MTLHFLTLHIWTFTILWDREHQLVLQNNNLQARPIRFHQLRMSANDLAQGPQLFGF